MSSILPKSPLARKKPPLLRSLLLFWGKSEVVLLFMLSLTMISAVPTGNVVDVVVVIVVTAVVVAIFVTVVVLVFVVVLDVVVVMSLIMSSLLSSLSSSCVAEYSSREAATLTDGQAVIQTISTHTQV